MPERSILLVRLAAFNRKKVLHDTRHILGNFDPLSGHKSWGGLCVLFEKRLRDGIQRALTGFAAGAMLHVVVEELIPEMSLGQHSNVGTVFFAVGFSVMMVLDVALG